MLTRHLQGLEELWIGKSSYNSSNSCHFVKVNPFFAPLRCCCSPELFYVLGTLELENLPRQRSSTERRAQR